MPAFERLTEMFYARVAQHAHLAPLFAHVDPGHAHAVAVFIAEVCGGPAEYSDRHGGHAAMIRRHLQRHLDETRRRAWMNLLLDCLDPAGLPNDPEFRSAFVGYLEWGTRLAVINSNAGAIDVPKAPMPRWGWGEPGGPYRGG